jgi:hypothetical protein
MDLTEGSETSAQLIPTPGICPKESIHDSEHGENLKSRVYRIAYVKYTTLLFTISNMFEWIHTEEGKKI